MKQRANTILSVFALTLIVGGSLYIALPKYRVAVAQKEGKAHNKHNLAAAKSQLLAQEKGVPLAMLDPQTWQSLRMHRLGIDIGLRPGVYYTKTATWAIDRQHAFIMPETVIPTIYGHNIDAVFKPLAGIAADELLTIQDNQGRTFLFAYRGEQKVKPSDSHILEDTADDTLRLITCDTAPFSYRRVLEFSYRGVLPTGQTVANAASIGQPR